MRNTHQMVVHNVCKVVSWEAVIFNDHLIINHVVFKYYFAVHQILELCFAFRDFHPDYEWLAFCLFLRYLIRIVAMSAKPVIHCFRILLTSNLDSHFCQTLCCAKTWICISILNQVHKHLNLPQAKSSHIFRRFSIVVIRNKVLSVHHSVLLIQDLLSNPDQPTSSSWLCLQLIPRLLYFGRCLQFWEWSHRRATLQKDSYRGLS